MITNFKCLQWGVLGSEWTTGSPSTIEISYGEHRIIKGADGNMYTFSF